MNKILERLDKYTFRQIGSGLLLLTIILSMPLLFWLSQERSTFRSRAEVLPTTIPTPIIFGAIPQKKPVIESIVPFTGKVGDAVIVRGSSLGELPANSRIMFGKTEVKDIVSWIDTEIVFNIPKNVSSGQVELEIGDWKIVWPREITVYNAQTKTVVEDDNGYLAIRYPNKVAFVKIWKKNLSEPKIVAVKTVIGQQFYVSQEKINEITWILLLDNNQQLIPFYSNLKLSN